MSQGANLALHFIDNSHTGSVEVNARIQKKKKSLRPTRLNINFLNTKCTLMLFSAHRVVITITEPNFWILFFFFPSDANYFPVPSALNFILKIRFPALELILLSFFILSTFNFCAKYFNLIYFTFIEKYKNIKQTKWKQTLTRMRLYLY